MRTLLTVKMILHYFHMILQPCGATCISDRHVRKYLFMKFSNDISQVTANKKKQASSLNSVEQLLFKTHHIKISHQCRHMLE